MGLRLKEDVDPEILRKYGFKTGKEWADAGERCLEGPGCETYHPWYHKFLMDKEHPEKIAYTDEEYDLPMVQISIRIGVFFKNDMYVDCSPCDTYHIGGSELDILLETIFDMVNDGILVNYKE